MPNSDTWFPIAAIALLLLMLITPVVTFCRRGWKVRKDSILANFDVESAELYLKTFHANKFETLAGNTPLEKLASHYDSHFSRLSFVCPGILGTAVAAVLLIPCGQSIHDWLRQQSVNSGTFPMVVVLAIAGGYVWVLFDIILKSFSQLLSPRDLYWAAFRLVICVPVGYAVGQLASEALRDTLAFCLGALPAWSIRSISRQLVHLTSKTELTSDNYFSQLTALPGVDVNSAQAMLDEGITSIDQLAAWDPVKLTIRLGQPFSYIVGVLSDALLWLYLRSADHAQAFRLCGVNGAYDCALLYERLEDKEPDAKAIVVHLAELLKVPEAGMQALLYDVAKDPNTRFIYAVWGRIT